MNKLDKLLIKANQQLKSGNTGITIFKRGNKLSLRGMLPLKSGDGSSLQTISLEIYANGGGVAKAKLKVQQLGSAIVLGEFDWNDYLSSSIDYYTVSY